MRVVKSLRLVHWKSPLWQCTEHLTPFFTQVHRLSQSFLQLHFTVAADAVDSNLAALCKVMVLLDTVCCQFS